MIRKERKNVREEQTKKKKNKNKTNRIWRKVNE